MRRADLILIVYLLFGVACGNSQTGTELTSTASISPSPQSSEMFSPTTTSLPPTPTATFTPVEGITLTQINVRTGPGTEYTSLGLIDPNQKVQIIGRNLGSQWYAILYSTGPQGRGWITANYVQAAGNGDLPVISNATTQETPSNNTGRTLQQINVRAGPGTDYPSLGMITPNTTIILTGKNETASWLQIEYAGASDNKGWVTAMYVLVNDVADLPILNAFSTPVTPMLETTTLNHASFPTSTLAPALLDGDSQSNPIAYMTFSINGFRQYTFSSDVSSPQGDAEDWIEFTPYASVPGASAHLYVSLICNGNGILTIDLWQNNQPTSDWARFACGDTNHPLTLTPTLSYQFHLHPTAGEGSKYIFYSLTVRNQP